MLIAGAYTATFGGAALGLFEGDAGLPAFEHTMTAEDVGSTSLYGKSVIDSIAQGGNCFVSFTCLESWIGGVRAAYWPYSATFGVMPVVGSLLYTASTALVFTAVAGTPAAASPATLTASRAILAAGFSSRIMFGPTLRKVPIRMRLYPFLSGGGAACWVTST